MSPARLVEREKRLLGELIELVRSRAEAAVAIETASRAAHRSAASSHEQELADIAGRFESDQAAAERGLRSTRKAVSATHEAQSNAIDRESNAAIQLIVNEINRAERDAHKAIDEARWLARTVFDASRKREAQNIAEIQQQLRSRLRTVRAIESEAITWLERVGHHSVVVQTEVPTPKIDSQADAAETLGQAVESGKVALQNLKALGLPGLVQGANLLWIYLVSALVISLPVGWLADWRPLPWIVPTVVLTAAAGAGLTVWLRSLARQQTAARFRPLLAAVRLADEAGRSYLEHSVARYKRKRSKIRRQRDAEYAHAAEKHAPILAVCRRRRDVDLPKLTAEANERLIVVQKKFDEDLAVAVELAGRLTAEARRWYEQSLLNTQDVNRRTVAANLAANERAREQWLVDWQANYAALQSELLALRHDVAAGSPPWETVLAADWLPPKNVPTAIRFGELTLDMRGHAGPEIVEHPELTPESLVFKLPALLDFPRASSMFVKTHGAGRQRAIDLLQVVMLRLLTAVPPGKLRFTIVDPVGLGQNFASFMHLADHDEALVSYRIWTEPAQIEQRLTDLTEHIETVIQKYLRNEFPTIEAYNEAAGEVAEAFRVLVVANYPAGFTEASARRLLSIAASGLRCGVQLLISVDTKLPPLPGISVADLQKHAVVFTTTGEQTIWHDEVYKDLPLTVDDPPIDDFKRVLHTIGGAAQSAKRVEVPFEAIAPPRTAYWQSDSRRGIDVPLGRAGATRLQHLRLGQGTSQHVLIAGKTGSGKSTLLHALITNAALRYSPDELELYLIDFKKGVEFKTYVTHELPHARVIAIESEREFGLSVMQRLDAEMRVRGERFREVGVQDIGGYRDTGQRLPRILFIVDEFQEFFVEDDKVAQEASLLLDRLVRQGRAFGIHVHLGSQTLGGAYSLARTTLGQMAVRIALQCSEADAHLILSEDNSAARLLSRPGEAIYNDANGLVEGNHPFQVVWLPDDRREAFLDEVTRLAAERPSHVRRPQIVFEGTQPADMDKSEVLNELLATAATTPLSSSGATAGSTHSVDVGAGTTNGTRGSASSTPRVWLGEPLAISDATSYSFPRRGGANLLLLGQNDEAAAGMLIASLVSLAAQLPAPGTNGDAATAQFVILNGGLSDREYTAHFRKLPAWLAPRVRVAQANETAAVMADLAADVVRRHTAIVETAPRFLFVFDLPRLRDLRKQEDDFSFSRSTEEKPPRPDQQFAEVLRDGPSLGVHTLLWCDSLTNFQRMLERQALKEFEVRVLLQMSAADSSLLIDSPGASTLGRHRALLHREDEGRLEKFRPYSPPSEPWLTRACQQIAKRPANPEPLSPTLGEKA
ncbi:MAG TPA: FtsK/SpoIIIE domain-containing protein [Pirellulales bacterium]|jgi:hypothetical protein